MEKEKVSIIMPVYNVAEYLYECLESVDKQTYTNFELLIIDDGSTDGSGVLCDKFSEKHSYCKVFHTENGGVSSARNHGLDRATGKYIVFVDSDDVLGECYLEALVLLMGKSKDQMAIVGYDENGTSCLEDVSSLSTAVSVNVDDIYDIIIRDRSVGGYLWNKIFLRSIVEKERIRFLSGVTIWEDVYFVLQYMNNLSNIVLSKSRFYYYRQRITSAVKQMSLEKKYNKVEIAKKISDFKRNGCEQFHRDSDRSYLRTYFDYCWSAYIANKLNSNDKNKFLSEIERLNGKNYFSFYELIKIQLIRFCYRKMT